MVNVVLKEGVNWVGVVDWNIRDFHGYITKRGSTYNSYLISGRKNSAYRHREKHVLQMSLWSTSRS